MIVCKQFWIPQGFPVVMVKNIWFHYVFHVLARLAVILESGFERSVKKLPGVHVSELDRQNSYNSTFSIPWDLGNLVT